MVNTSKNVAQKSPEKPVKTGKILRNCPSRMNSKFNTFLQSRKQADREKTGGNPFDPEGCDRVEYSSTCQMWVQQKEVCPFRAHISANGIAILPDRCGEPAPHPRGHRRVQAPSCLREVGLMRKDLPVPVRDQPAP